MFWNKNFHVFDVGRDYIKSIIVRQKPYDGIIYLICIIQQPVSGQCGRDNE